MNEKMKYDYAALTRLYTIHKSIQQLSWYLANIQKKYPYDQVDPMDAGNIQRIAELYDSFSDQLENLYLQTRKVKK